MIDTEFATESNAVRWRRSKHNNHSQFSEPWPTGSIWNVIIPTWGVEGIAILALPLLILSYLLLPRKAQSNNSEYSLIYNMSLATVGAAVLVLCIVAYAMSHATDSDVDLHDPKIFQERKNLYRNKRDDFRRNFRAMEELREWKAKNDDYDYVEL